MLTTDFTGTYDYEKEEAEHAANYILEDIACGYLDLEDIQAKVDKERVYWKKCIPEAFEEFDKYFLEFIKNGMESALKSRSEAQQ
jgi:hypothetical protein